MGDKLKINNIEIPLSLIAGFVIVVGLVLLIVFGYFSPDVAWQQLMQVLDKVLK